MSCDRAATDTAYNSARLERGLIIRRRADNSFTGQIRGGLAVTNVVVDIDKPDADCCRTGAAKVEHARDTGRQNRRLDCADALGIDRDITIRVQRAVLRFRERLTVDAVKPDSATAREADIAGIAGAEGQPDGNGSRQTLRRNLRIADREDIKVGFGKDIRTGNLGSRVRIHLVARKAGCGGNGF